MSDSEIFKAAVKLPPDQRQDYLDQACGADQELRREVESLLQEHDASDSFLERPAAERIATDAFHQACGETVEDAEHALDFLAPSEKPDCLGKIGHYEITGVVGRGGMGLVLKARDPKLERIVAVKVLAPELAANPTARKRFLREARAAAAVSHPHVVTIHAVDEDDKTPYLVMECIDGVTLQEKIDRTGALELREILRIGAQTAMGLAAAHAQGLVHRDVKPGNILLENGVERVRVSDFGLARAVDDVGMTQTGEVAGTPQHMSPEQALGQPFDHRSDLFSLGSVLYTMCTGRSPFRAETPVAAMRRVCDDTPRPIRQLNPDVPEWLVSIIDRLLAKDPDARFQTSHEVADLLGRHLAHLQHPTNAPPPGPLGVAGDAQARAGSADKRTGSPQSGPRRRLWAVAVLLLALLGGLGITEATGVTQLAATVMRVAVGEGTLVIEVDDPTVHVSIDGEDVSISGAGVEELRLRCGQHQFKAAKDGEPVKEELVTISRGGREHVRVLLETFASSQVAAVPFSEQQAEAYQEECAERFGVPVDFQDPLGIDFRLIPPGTFEMGSPPAEVNALLRELELNGAGEFDEFVARSSAPRHQVRLNRPLYLASCEVTVAQFRKFVDETGYQSTLEAVKSPPFTWKTLVPNDDPDQRPVIGVSWEDAKAFCRWLSKQHQIKYELPTEAQWEYACRAGSAGMWSFGDDTIDLAKHAVCEQDADSSPAPIAGKQPNAFGLFDMHGNADEWCLDWHKVDFYGRSPTDDPVCLESPADPASGRVVRGGAWNGPAWWTRVTTRGYDFPGLPARHHGFRVAIVGDLKTMFRIPK